MAELSKDDRARLRDLFAWARANGWKRIQTRNGNGQAVRRRGFHEWERADSPEFVHLGEGDDFVQLIAAGSFGNLDVWVAAARPAADLLAAAGLLPAVFSSQYRAGHSAAQEATTLAYRAGLDAGAESCRREWAERTTGVYYGIRTPGRLSVRQHNEKTARHLARQFPKELELVSRPVIRWELVPDA